MVVNFRASGISRGARKAGPDTHIKLKKKKKKVWQKHVLLLLLLEAWFFK
jgi:hypothetical protein